MRRDLQEEVCQLGEKPIQAGQALKSVPVRAAAVVAIVIEFMSRA